MHIFYRPWQARHRRPTVVSGVASPLAARVIRDVAGAWRMRGKVRHGRIFRGSLAGAARWKFPQGSLLLNLLCALTVALTLENFLLHMICTFHIAQLCGEGSNAHRGVRTLVTSGLFCNAHDKKMQLCCNCGKDQGVPYFFEKRSCDACQARRLTLNAQPTPPADAAADAARKVYAI